MQLIPNAFVNLLHSKKRVIPDFILRNSRARDWHVKAFSIGHELYFDDGWKRFKEENSLEDNDYIVFTHIENNVFEFKILELSSMCEKEKGNDKEEKNSRPCNPCKVSHLTDKRTFCLFCMSEHLLVDLLCFRVHWKQFWSFETWRRGNRWGNVYSAGKSVLFNKIYLLQTERIGTVLYMIYSNYVHCHFFIRSVSEGVKDGLKI